tara:strand:- start:168 stop:545 length:378 start_codon:yes stop_codon:yes gene_type:complete
MFQTNPNSNNNNNEDATRPVVARATHLAKLTTYPDFTDAAADIDMDIYPLWFSVQQVPADIDEDDEPSRHMGMKLVRKPILDPTYKKLARISSPCVMLAYFLPPSGVDLSTSRCAKKSPSIDTMG